MLNVRVIFLLAFQKKVGDRQESQLVQDSEDPSVNHARICARNVGVQERHTRFGKCYLSSLFWSRIFASVGSLDDALFEATAAGSGEVFAITVAQCQRVQCVGRTSLTTAVSFKMETVLLAASPVSGKPSAKIRS